MYDVSCSDWLFLLVRCDWLFFLVCLFLGCFWVFAGFSGSVLFFAVADNDWSFWGHNVIGCLRWVFLMLYVIG
jgi:hypothetical protein